MTRLGSTGWSSFLTTRGASVSGKRDGLDLDEANADCGLSASSAGGRHGSISTASSLVSL